MTETAQPNTPATLSKSASEDQEDQPEFKMTPSMIESLRATKPWTQLLAILGFISVFFMSVVSLISFIGFSRVPHPSSGAPFPFFLMGLGYLLIGLLYFVPSYLLLKYATSIGRFLDGGGQTSMEQALSYQKSFWKFVGIVGLISIGLALLGIFAAIIVPLFVRFMH